jgi:hypothetical protein
MIQWDVCSIFQLRAWNYWIAIQLMLNWQFSMYTSFERFCLPKLEITLILCRIICVRENENSYNFTQLIIFVAKIYHFAIKKGPKQHGQRNFWKVFQKICWISKKKVMKLSRFFEDSGRFLAFFFWNHHIKLVSSNGWSPTCNRIPKFCTSLFVLYRFG